MAGAASSGGRQWQQKQKSWRQGKWQQLVAILGGYCSHYTCKVSTTAKCKGMYSNTERIFKYTPSPIFNITWQFGRVKSIMCKINFTNFRYYMADNRIYSKIEFSCARATKTNFILI